MHELATWHFGHLPVWIDGNAYFNGATVSKHDRHCLVNESDRVFFTLVEEEGRCVLKTNVGQFLGQFRDSVITSDTLGRAFEPDQRFENPDETDIVFDRDYFGAHRSLSAVPGPFAAPQEEQLVWEDRKA